ncbi:MAG: competence/damage-inducible protein A [Candidatus Helarchaeota archaeon]|nr:competence/damage-inducible protein A [Candidatus Helarchaeota archaeon]
MKVEIINTGNELLNGKIKNTNIIWLIKKLNRLGARLIQYSVIPDDLEVICAALRAALERSTDVIITTGGLGATYDDMTLKAIAKVINRPLTLNSRALEMVELKFEYAKRLGWTYADLISDHWKKMAIIPEGSIPLENPPGAAPGVQITFAGKTIFALPGPPNELRAIFRKEIRPFLQQRIISKAPETHFYISGLIEPTISGIINNTFIQFKGVWVKSHPMLHTGKLMLEIHISLQEGYDSPELVENATSYFIREIEKLGCGKIIMELEVE